MFPVWWGFRGVFWMQEMEIKSRKVIKILQMKDEQIATLELEAHRFQQESIAAKKSLREALSQLDGEQSQVTEILRSKQQLQHSLHEQMSRLEEELGVAQEQAQLLAQEVQILKGLDDSTDGAEKSRRRSLSPGATRGPQR